MKLYSMLSIDLHLANTTQREKFNDAMARKMWKKADYLTSIWTGTFENVTDENEAFDMAKKIIMVSAKHAGIAKFSLSIHFGAKDIFHFNY